MASELDWVRRAGCGHSHDGKCEVAKSGRWKDGAKVEYSSGSILI